MFIITCGMGVLVPQNFGNEYPRVGYSSITFVSFNQERGGRCRGRQRQRMCLVGCAWMCVDVGGQLQLLCWSLGAIHCPLPSPWSATMTLGSPLRLGWLISVPVPSQHWLCKCTPSCLDFIRWFWGSNQVLILGRQVS